MITYDPASMLKKIAPDKKIKRLLKGNLTVNKAALSFVNDIDFIDKTNITNVALKVAKSYRARVDADTAEKSELKADPALLIQRVQNEVVLQISQSIKLKYEGEAYVWLPSSAEIPDPEHALNYGKTFLVGDGEMPGERIGCQCGMQILVKQTQLEL